MCNIYKNNLIILSQLEKHQLLYIKEDTNQLKLDNRYLTYLRNKTEENKIGNIINTSFINITNNYILNISYNESINNMNGEHDLSLSLEENIEAIKNTRELLHNALKGLHTYHTTLLHQNHNYLPLKHLYNKLKDILDNIETYRNSYIGTIKNDSIQNKESNGWLYNLYLSAFTPKSTKVLPKPIEEEEKEEEEEEIKTPNTYDKSSQNKSDNNYVYGLIYIVSRKIGNFFISLGNHIRYILGNNQL